MNQGKVYMLTLGQCTQELKDDWEKIVAVNKPIWLINLIEKYVLKQTESHHPFLTVHEEMPSMLNFSQGEDMMLSTYYIKFTICVAISDFQAVHL